MKTNAKALNARPDAVQKIVPDYRAAGFGLMDVHKKRMETTEAEFLAWQQELIEAGFAQIDWV